MEHGTSSIKQLFGAQKRAKRNIGLDVGGHVAWTAIAAALRSAGPTWWRCDASSASKSYGYRPPKIRRTPDIERNLSDADPVLDSMRIVVVSDTHMLHRRLVVPEGDVLVHCGDWPQEDSVADYDDFFEWYGALPHAHKLLTAGNHESLMLDFESLVCPRIPKNVAYLRDDGVTLDGLRFWASPYSMAPTSMAFPSIVFTSMAFTFKRIGDARRHWAKIPHDTDVLITHGPPYGILDESGSGQHIGDPTLYQRVEVVKPRLHLFGHVHVCGGKSLERFGTTFVNAAIGDDPTANLDARIQVLDLS